jgi:hypothetical protein
MLHEAKIGPEFRKTGTKFNRFLVIVCRRGEVATRLRFLSRGNQRLKLPCRRLLAGSRPGTNQQYQKEERRQYEFEAAVHVGIRIGSDAGLRSYPALAQPGRGTLGVFPGYQ